MKVSTSYKIFKVRIRVELLRNLTQSAHLLAVVSYRLQDGPQCFDLNSNIKQMGSKEEIIEVAQNGEGEIPQAVQECLKFTQKVTYLSVEISHFFTLSVMVTPAFQTW
jgi:hypothetical protein